MNAWRQYLRAEIGIAQALDAPQSEIDRLEGLLYLDQLRSRVARGTGNRRNYLSQQVARTARKHLSYTTDYFDRYAAKDLENKMYPYIMHQLYKPGGYGMRRAAHRQARNFSRKRNRY